MKKIMIILGALLLQGCVPTVFVAGAAVGGAVIYDNRSSSVMLQDRSSTFKMQANLDHDKELHQKAHISITCFNQIALLVGQAPTEELRDRAEAIAKTNTKIKMLYNEVTVEPSLPVSKYANDSWITTKIKTVLLATPSLSSTNLKVVTENGVVYLLGLTTRTQAQLAVDKAQTVSGVQKIVKLFEYLN